MYKYRKLNEIQKQDVLNYRKFAQLPLHEPPHFFDDINKSYILTASNFEHKSIMNTAERRKSFEFMIWNKEDKILKRVVWLRYSDRKIRNSNHFWASVNYINTNPVKHHLVTTAMEWETSSIRRHMEEHGRDKLRQLWESYPVLDYGKGWDD